MLTVDEWHASGERIELGGHPIFVRTEGSGSWLTLLHGFPTSSWDWAKVWPQLAAHHKLLALDFLGFGASAKPRGHRYTIAEQADIVEAMWRHHGVTRTALLVHDYGGTVTEELLARAQDGKLAVTIERVTFLNGALIGHLNRILPIQRALRVRGLGWVVSSLVTRGMFAKNFRTIFSPAHPISEPELEQHWRAISLERGHRLYHRLVHHYGEHERHADRWEGVLARTAVPLQAVWGMGDPVSGPDMVAYFREHAPRMVIHELDGIRHYPQLEVPDVVAAKVLAR